MKRDPASRGDARGGPRFLLLAEVAELLNISASQAYALVRTKDLKAIKIGGRGHWRVEVDELEAYIRRAYQQTDEYLDAHPFGGTDEPAELD